MKRNRATFVIDGNYHLFRSLFILPKTDGKHINNDEDASFYMQKLATDLAYQIRGLGDLVDEVVWTIDSKSWRKDFYPEAEYKANRKPNETVNWDNFKRISSDFIKILESAGVVISKIDGAEGDDLMYVWSIECLSKNKPVILSTGDRDMIQTVSNNSENVQCVVLSPASKNLYAPIGFNDWLNEEVAEEVADDEIDIFNASKISINIEQEQKNSWKYFLKSKKFKLCEVDTIDFIFKKILTGDGGDNVPPAYYYTKTSSNGKTRRYGISDNKAEIILDEFKKRHGEITGLYLFNNEILQDFADITFTIMKAKYMSREQIFNNLKMNIDLMVLSKRTIPEGIVDDIFKHIENSDRDIVNISKVSDVKNLLENTKFNVERKKSKSMNSSFFDKDDSNDFSFIKKNSQGNKKLF